MEYLVDIPKGIRYKSPNIAQTGLRVMDLIQKEIYPDSLSMLP